MKLSKNHTINEYNKYCKSFSFKPKSDSTLWQILKALKPSAQQAMAGLDNVAAYELQGFKGATKLYFTHYSCGVMILLNTGL